MGNRDKLRAFREQQEQAARDELWASMRAAPWDPDQLARPEPALPRAQIMHVPSWGPYTFWEIDQSLRGFTLHAGTVIADLGSIRWLVRGFEPVPFPSQALQDYLHRLTALTIPLSLSLEYVGALDGETTRLAIFGSPRAAVRLEWWDAPEGWEPLVQLVQEMRAAFERARDSQGPPV